MVDSGNIVGRDSTSVGSGMIDSGIVVALHGGFIGGD